MEKTGNPKKTKKILIPVVILLVLAILGGSAYFIYRLCFARHAKNVFEEIYYIQTSPKGVLPDGIKVELDTWGKWHAPAGENYCYSFYSREHSSWTEVIYINCYRSSNNRIEFVHKYFGKSSPENPDIKVIYTLKNRTLTVEGTNSTDASFIFETLLPAWFEGMGDRSSYSMENLGVFTDLTGQ